MARFEKREGQSFNNFLGNDSKMPDGKYRLQVHGIEDMDTEKYDILKIHLQVLDGPFAGVTFSTPIFFKKFGSTAGAHKAWWMFAKACELDGLTAQVMVEPINREPFVGKCIEAEKSTLANERGTYVNWAFIGPYTPYGNIPEVAQVKLEDIKIDEEIDLDDDDPFKGA